MNPALQPGRFYKRPGALRALAPTVRARQSTADELATSPPPLAWRALEELRRAAEDLGIDAERMTRRELLDAIRDSLPLGNPAALPIVQARR